MSISRRLVFSSLFSLAILGCGAADTEPLAPLPASGGAHWAYRGNEGPAHWGDNPAFAACANGHAQSPLDLSLHAEKTGKSPSIPAWAPVPVRVTNNGHTTQVDSTSESAFVVGGTSYRLAQFHFHSPSEHTIDGRAFDLEMHLVHKSAEGKLLVVALLFSRGKANEILRPVWDFMPPSQGTSEPQTAATVNIEDLLPSAPHYLTYDGSLTAPPCTEGVTWMVALPDAQKPLEVSDVQIEKFRAAVAGESNRPVQQKNGRVVTELLP